MEKAIVLTRNRGGEKANLKSGRHGHPVGDILDQGKEFEFYVNATVSPGGF